MALSHFPSFLLSTTDWSNSPTTTRSKHSFFRPSRSKKTVHYTCIRTRIVFCHFMKMRRHPLRALALIRMSLPSLSLPLYPSLLASNLFHYELSTSASSHVTYLKSPSFPSFRSFRLLCYLLRLKFIGKKASTSRRSFAMLFRVPSRRRRRVSVSSRLGVLFFSSSHSTN
jgi:hypothetical protein